MALSGSFTGTTSNQFVQPKITWLATQSVSGNYSDVTATLTYSRTNSGYTTYGTWSGAINIGGTSTSGSKVVTITQNSNTVAITATTRIYHGADGSKSITISASGKISGTTVTSTTISSTVTIDTIPRATTPVFSAGSVNMGGTVTISLDRASTSFTHHLSYSFGSLTEQTSGLSGWSGIGTSATFTPPINLANQIPNAVSSVCTLTCQTVNNGVVIGTKTATITINVPENVLPSISNVQITEATSGIASKFNAFVQGKSTLNVSITATGAYGSTITSYETYIQSVLYRGNSFTSNVITTSGTIGVRTIVSDSRGRSYTVTNNISVTAYSPPQINSFSAWRINTSGTEADEGTRIGLRVNYAISPVGNQNDRTFNYQYKRSIDSSFTSFSSGTASWTYEGTELFTTAPAITTDNAYVIRLTISDYFQTVTYDVQIPTVEVIMDFKSNGKGIAFGKVSESDGIEFGWNTDFKGQLTMSDDAFGNRKNVVTHTANITINGSSNTYYPVVITELEDKQKRNEISVWRNLYETCATYEGNHSASNSSSLWLTYEYRSTKWDGNGGFCRTTAQFEPYATLIGKAEVEETVVGSLTLWLRGGTTLYHISTDADAEIDVYYTNTNIGTSAYPVYVAPITSPVTGGWCVLVGATSDCVISSGVSGVWNWRKWASGVSECFGKVTFTDTVSVGWGSIFSNSAQKTFSFPGNLFNNAPQQHFEIVSVNPHNSLGIIMDYGVATATMGGGFYFWRPTAATGTLTIIVAVHAIGTWK